MDVHQLIGLRIREARKQRGMRQEELAASMGVTRTSVSNYERGVQNLTIESLYSLCEALKLEPYTLLPHLEDVKGLTHSEPVEFWERVLVE